MRYRTERDIAPGDFVVVDDMLTLYVWRLRRQVDEMACLAGGKVTRLAWFDRYGDHGFWMYVDDWRW